MVTKKKLIYCANLHLIHENSINFTSHKYKLCAFDMNIQHGAKIISVLSRIKIVLQHHVSKFYGQLLLVHR